MDTTGKLFIAEELLPRCLVCERLVTPRAAALHRQVPCISPLRLHCPPIRCACGTCGVTTGGYGGDAEAGCHSELDRHEWRAYDGA